MPKLEWGTKRTCPTTGKRFYDLNRTPIVSPYTGEVVDIESVRRKMAASVISRAVPEKDDDVLVEPIEGADAKPVRVAVAQNPQPIAQPTWDETQMLHMSRAFRMSTVSIIFPSTVRSNALYVSPAWLLRT